MSIKERAQSFVPTDLKYLVKPLEYFDAASFIRNWNHMPESRNHLLAFAKFRMNKDRNSSRRFPEYRASYTISAMGTIWEEVTQSKLPASSLDASNQLITLVYALDDMYDSPEFDKSGYQHLDAPDSLNLALENVKENVYIGHDILNHLLSTIALDYPDNAPRQQEIVNDIVRYLHDFHQAHTSPQKEPWDYHSALEMRKKVSGNLGALIGKIFSYSIDSDVPSSGIAAMEMMAIGGQYHDEVWDLFDENTSNSHNMYLLLSREQFPDEYTKLVNVIQEKSKQTRDMLTYKELQMYTPHTLEMFFQEMARTTKECIYKDGEPNDRLLKIRQWTLDEFEPMLSFFRKSPQRIRRLRIKKNLVKKH